MVIDYFPRSTWTPVPRPIDALAPLVSSEVKGVAVHYTGDKQTYGQTATLTQTCARLEGERKFHTQSPPAGRGWTDIAYQAAIDQSGRVLDCRGIEYRSAANGDQKVNRAYGAVTFLVGVPDEPSPAAIAAFRNWRVTAWLARYPRATAVVPHSGLYPTACPGAPLTRLVRIGALVGGANNEDYMPITDADADRIITRMVGSNPFMYAVRRAVWQATWPLSAEPDAETEQADIRLYRASHPEHAAEVIADRVLALLGDTVRPSHEEIKNALREVIIEGTGGTP